MLETCLNFYFNTHNFNGFQLRVDTLKTSVGIPFMPLEV